MKRYIKADYGRYTNYEKIVDRFLSTIGFDEPYYTTIISSYNTTEEYVVVVSFTDGITIKDYGIIKWKFGQKFPDAGIYLSKRHKDSSIDNDMCLEIEFEFPKV